MLKQTLALTSCCCLLLGSNFVFDSIAVAENVVVCESREGRSKRCAMDTRGGVELIDVLSDTSCRGRWSSGRGYVEVRDGCRARFASEVDFDDNYDSGDRVTCASKDGETRRCRINGRGRRVRLIRQLSNASCEDNWRYRDGYVIVRNGCRGEFEARRRR